MAALLNKIGYVGMAIAASGAVASSVLYNGERNIWMGETSFWDVLLRVRWGWGMFGSWKTGHAACTPCCLLLILTGFLGGTVFALYLFWCLCGFLLSFHELAVEGGHRAVIFDRFRGVLPSVAGEGTHFFVPWVQQPIIYDVRSQPRNVPVMTPSKGKGHAVVSGALL
jgi:hypothetical protein